MTAHTPAPWRWTANDKPIDIATYKSTGFHGNAELRSMDGTGIIECDEYDVIGPDCGEERIANARLIAAAPDLLAALMDIEDCDSPMRKKGTQVDKQTALRRWSRARHAIVKATGQCIIVEPDEPDLNATDYREELHRGYPEAGR